jgi:hypothetical protein
MTPPAYILLAPLAALGCFILAVALWVGVLRWWRDRLVQINHARINRISSMVAGADPKDLRQLLEIQAEIQAVKRTQLRILTIGRWLKGAA